MCLYWAFWLENSVFDPQNGQNLKKIICILTAAKIYTSNFSGTPFGHIVSVTRLEGFRAQKLSKQESLGP